MQLFKNTYFKNIFWNFVNQFGKSGFQIIVTLILARLLSPSDFGIIAMVLVITQFAELIIDSGFLLGIVQLKDITQKELSSVFYLNLVIGFGCSIIIYFSAPLIANLYHNPDLIIITKFLAISCIFTASSVVQHGLMIKEMNYKKRTITQLISQLLSGIIAISFAMNGVGVMALVYYNVIQSILSALFYWIQSSWRPSLHFEFKELKRIWTFSSNILGVTILGNIAGRTDLFLTGKFFSPSVLGFYSKGKDFAMLPATVGGEIANLSLFPILTRLDGDEFDKSFRKSLKMLTLISSIGFGVLCVNAHEITTLLLGEGWIEAGVIFQFYFIVAFFYLINSFLTSVINATGKSRVNLIKELIQAPLRITVLILIYYALQPTDTLPFIYFWILYYILSNAYSQFLLCKIRKLNLWENLVIGLPYIVIALGSGIATGFLIEINSEILSILSKSLSFLSFFTIGLLITKDNVLKTVLGYLRINK